VRHPEFPRVGFSNVAKDGATAFLIRAGEVTVPKRSTVRSARAGVTNSLREFFVLAAMEQLGDGVIAGAVFDELVRTQGEAPNSGSFYALIERLDGSGQLRSRYVDERDGGPPRRYLSLTAKGRDILKTTRRRLRAYVW